MSAGLYIVARRDNPQLNLITVSIIAGPFDNFDEASKNIAPAMKLVPNKFSYVPSDRFQIMKIETMPQDDMYGALNAELWVQPKWMD